MKTLKSKIIGILAALFLVGGAFALGSGVHLVANSASAAPTLYSQNHCHVYLQ